MSLVVALVASTAACTSSRQPDSAVPESGAREAGQPLDCAVSGPPHRDRSCPADCESILARVVDADVPCVHQDHVIVAGCYPPGSEPRSGAEACYRSESGDLIVLTLAIYPELEEQGWVGCGLAPPSCE